MSESLDADSVINQSDHKYIQPNHHELFKLATAAVMKPSGFVAAQAPASSAAGVLALLDEEDDSLKLYALQQLDNLVHDFWFQISGSIATIEALYEDEEFTHRELAALVASKVPDHNVMERFPLRETSRRGF